ncbi:MAG: hypothetical protein AB7E95_09085 [Kiritimatiellales bacterium]
MNLFRIHIRPQGGSDDMEKTFQYCMDNNLLGIGWRLKTRKNITDWAEYFDEASKIHSNLNSCKYIENRINRDDLVWTRDTKGNYYLAKVASGWEYWMSDEAFRQDIDIANIFRVIFQKVPIDLVPGKVVACFRATRTIQQINDSNAREYSKYLWNHLSGEEDYAIAPDEFSDIFMMLDDEETEDLVFLYLQSHGWYVVPNSRKADTMSFEYLAVNPQNGKQALTQVKTGNTPLNRENYSAYSCEIFLFQANELYSGKSAKNVTCLTRNEIREFLEKSIDWLPAIFRTKSEMINIS